MESLGTVEKAIDVLFHLHGTAGSTGVTEIGRELGMPKSSVHRLLAALGRRGLVERDDRGRYRPGVGLLALGLGVLEREPVVAAGRSVLEVLAQTVGETCFLVAARGGRLFVLDKVEGTGFLRAAPTVGASLPVHATAVGKLYLAFGPDQLALGPDDSVREGFTPATLVQRKALAREIEAVRERGHASNREEWIPGLSVVAAPIWLSGRIAGAVAIAASTPQMVEIGSGSVASQVCEAAAHMTARLEGREHRP